MYGFMVGPSKTAASKKCTCFCNFLVQARLLGLCHLLLTGLYFFNIGPPKYSQTSSPSCSVGHLGWLEKSKIQPGPAAHPAPWDIWGGWRSKLHLNVVSNFTSFPCCTLTPACCSSFN